MWIETQPLSGRQACANRGGAASSYRWKGTPALAAVREHVANTWPGLSQVAVARAKARSHRATGWQPRTAVTDLMLREPKGEH